MNAVYQRDWRARFAVQNFCCAACKSDHPGSKKGWHTDHDHMTGLFRGILCQSCNLILGHAKDNPQKLIVLLEYLGR
jgi:hypothetical protein